MSALLIAGLGCLFVALLIFIRFHGDHKTDNHFIGLTYAWLMIVGIVLVMTSVAWWIVTHFAYVGGAA